MSDQGEWLPVMESFHTIQGEGLYAGVPAYFIRLGGCDVGCTWCDVKESWEMDRHPRVSVSELAERAVASGAPICVVTGGEPAMHPLGPLTRELHKAGLRTHIETSGTHPLSGEWDWVTFSPKKFKPPVGGIYPLADELKVIVYHPSDLEWAQTFVPLLRSSAALLLQPEWGRRDRMTPLIVDFVRSHPQWRISLQTHKYIGVD